MRELQSIEPKRFVAWGLAVGAMYEAQAVCTPEAWCTAADAWDALVALHGPNERDRTIFKNLADEARAKAGV